jgi:hypothetical protein
MDDLEHSRDEAVAQYQQALVNRDGQLDTKEAAERGLKEPYGPPPGTHPQEDDSDDSPPAQKPDASPQTPTPQSTPPPPPAAATPQL